MAKHKHSHGARANRHVPKSVPLVQWDEADLYRWIETQEAPFILVLDGVQDPHNLGACLRTADAAGVDVVLVPRKGTAPRSETVCRIACGAAERIPLIAVSNLAQVLNRLSALGLNLVGAADQADTSLYDTALSGPLVLLAGSEEKGLRSLTRKCCDHLVSIPMLGKTSCLNLSVAVGVCLFEAVRQRRGINES